MDAFDLTRGDLSLMRQWFDCVQDLNPQYLTWDDFQLARRLYEVLEMRVPSSVEIGCANVNA